MLKKIDIGKEFYHRLANRDDRQGDGKKTAVEFREKYLSDLDNSNVWKDDKEIIQLDFINVKKLGPSFANEAFAYFTQYAQPERILKKIKLLNISKVKELIILQELKTGYSRK